MNTRQLTRPQAADKRLVNTHRIKFLGPGPDLKIILSMSHLNFRTPSKSGVTLKTPDKSSRRSTPAKSTEKLALKSPKSKSAKSTPSRSQPTREKEVPFAQSWKNSFVNAVR